MYFFKKKNSIDFYRNSFENPFLNFALDELLFLKYFSKSQKNPFLHIYQWKKKVISIGYLQKIETINRDLCEKYHIPIIRRITGGRTVYHHPKEITMALGFSKNHLKKKFSESPHFKKDLAAFISLLIQSILKEFNFDFKVQKNLSGNLKNLICFNTKVPFEINSIDDQKIMGMAILVKNEYVLCQVSLFLETHLIKENLNELKYLLNYDKDTSPLQVEFLKQKKNNNDFIIQEKFINLLKRKFPIKKKILSDSLFSEIKTLSQLKYQNANWNGFR